MSDVAARAKAALAAKCGCDSDPCGWQDMQFAEDCRGTEDCQGLIPELVAEIEQVTYQRDALLATVANQQSLLLWMRR